MFDPQTQSSVSVRTLVQWLISFFLLLQLRYHLTDKVLNLVFGFLKVLLTVLGVCTCLFYHWTSIPPTLYQASKGNSINTEKFTQFVVCKQCYTIHHIRDCIDGYSAYQTSKTCHWPFRSHITPLKWGGILPKTVEMASGWKLFHPLKTYCYIIYRNPCKECY